MRAGLAQREPARVAHWEKTGLYGALQRRRAGAPVFVLHDGPPFTNGDVHIGTALNKTLKDVTVRYRTMRGFRAPFVPGWDCHGLPIEQSVARELREANRQVSTSELRRLCDAFSESWITKQRAQFQRLGVLGDWANEYKTKAPAFEADILRTFAAFVDKGIVYRSKKPSTGPSPSRRRLPEAEVEYKEHSSPSIWVPLRRARRRGGQVRPARRQAPQHRDLDDDAVDPPGNLAGGAQPEGRLRRGRLGAERIIVAAALLAQVLPRRPSPGRPRSSRRCSESPSSTWRPAIRSSTGPRPSSSLTT